MSKIIENRYEFILLADVLDGNPNGDPDMNNAPRIDTATNHGLITDACTKRKIRNYVAMTQEDQAPNRIFVREKSILNDTIQAAYAECQIDLTQPQTQEGAKRSETKTKGLYHGLDTEKQSARTRLCQQFYDVRTFGAVLSTGWNCGEVRGPVQFGFGRSIDPILIQEHALTRVAVTTEEESIKQGGENQTMGGKYTVPYALYRIHGFISAYDAAKTGFTEDDLALLWEALANMYEHDRSAARGLMTTRGLYVFKHARKAGNASAAQLFERLQIDRRADVKHARKFADYDVQIIGEEIPHVELIRLVG